MPNLLRLAFCALAVTSLLVPLNSAANVPYSPTPAEVLKALTGSWEGTVRTWFEPGKLADESTVKGKFTPILGGRFLRHEYVGSMKGKPRTGEETIVYNKIAKQFEISWFDDFHMNYGILYSIGPATADGFSVIGKYAYGGKLWNWRTEYKLLDKDHLTITAYNTSPAGQEYKGVETDYHRVSN